jgi:hypothetical protein
VLWEGFEVLKGRFGWIRKRWRMEVEIVVMIASQRWKFILFVGL